MSGCCSLHCDHHTPNPPTLWHTPLHPILQNASATFKKPQPLSQWGIRATNEPQGQSV